MRDTFGIEACESLVGPGLEVNAVGDRVNAVCGEHTRGRLGVHAGDAIHVSGQAQGEARHVEAIAARKALQLFEPDQVRQKPGVKVVGKAIVPRLDRRVGGEHAAIAHLRDLVGRLTRLHLGGQCRETAEEIER